jgi:purine operon repressor
VIDDFMRGGGSLKGIRDILGEFDIMTVATGVALVAREPERKKVSDYLPILIIEEIDEENGIIRISANPEIFL